MLFCSCVGPCVQFNELKIFTCFCHLRLSLQLSLSFIYFFFIFVIADSTRHLLYIFNVEWSKYQHS